MNPQIKIARSPYLLERYDFDKLINSKGKWKSIAITLSGATIGFFINMIAKFIANKLDSTIKFENWEIFAFILALLLMSIFYIIDYCVPNERKDIITKIKTHFEPNTK